MEEEYTSISTPYIAGTLTASMLRMEWLAHTYEANIQRSKSDAGSLQVIRMVDWAGLIGQKVESPDL